MEPPELQPLTEGDENIYLRPSTFVLEVSDIEICRRVRGGSVSIHHSPLVLGQLL